MGQKYSSTSVSGFNASPPPDDGSQSASNKISWAIIKNKLADPLVNWAVAVNNALLNALDTSAILITSTYATVASDNGKTLQCAGTFTLSLADAASLGVGWSVSVKVISGTVTIARVTGANTIDGVAGNLTMSAGQSVTLSVNQGANGFNSTANPLFTISPAGIPEGIQATNIASAATINFDTSTGDYVHITGSTGPVSAITLSQGRQRLVVFDSTPVLTNGASLLLRNGISRTAVAGEVSMFRGEAAGVVREVSPVTTKQPTIQTFLSGSGTYTTPSGAIRLRVRMIGGGGAGCGSGSGPAVPVAATNTTFGTLTAGLGSAGSGVTAGAGGTGANGDINLSGGSGGTGVNVTNGSGGMGGSSMFGGAGGAGAGAGQAGQAAAANSGSGGGGGAQSSNASSGGGGGAGGYVEKTITSPAATYSYVVGTGGNTATAGTGGANGGSGSAGIIIVEEFYS